MKIEVITKEGAKAIRNLLNNHLKTVGEDLGMQISVGNCKYSSTGFTFKLEGSIQDSDGNFETKERIDFRSYARTFGLDPKDLDTRFEVRNEIYTIYGLKPRSPKYPILGQRVRDGRVFKFKPKTVWKGLM